LKTQFFFKDTVFLDFKKGFKGSERQRFKVAKGKRFREAKRRRFRLFFFFGL
jgi:hypothetical protein